MTHANAPLTPEGRRRLAVLVVDRGWPLRRAAERFQCSPATAKRWADRYRAGLALTDRSSRPRTSPNRLPEQSERRIVALRFTRRWGPHRIAYHLRLARSTVGRVLARYRMAKLANIDQATGLPVRKPKAVRYEVAAPGQLVHVDIKKQGGCLLPAAGSGQWCRPARQEARRLLPCVPSYAGLPCPHRSVRRYGRSRRVGSPGHDGHRLLIGSHDRPVAGLLRGSDTQRKRSIPNA